MERNLDWNLRRCLVWETEKPFKERPRESPAFSFQGCVCCLTLSVTQEFDNRCYRLKIKSNGGYDSFQACNVTVHVKRRTGSIALTQTYAHRWWESNYYIWSHYESDILKEIRDFDSDGLLRFFVFFDDYTIEHTLSLKSGKDISVQTEEKCDRKNEKFVHQEEKPTQTALYMNVIPCLESLSEDLSKLLDKGSHQDVELKCGDHTVSAHKTVLSTRSQVFAKMLQSDMVEGRTGLVEIQDMDYEVLVDFLRYLYTGMLPELNTDSARKFYEAGDKFAVERLVRRCADFLMENLTPENACEILALADAHSDREFKEVIIVYILDKKIPLLNDQWEVFCSGHPVLANEVLNRFCKLYLSQEV